MQRPDGLLLHRTSLYVLVIQSIVAATRPFQLPGSNLTSFCQNDRNSHLLQRPPAGSASEDHVAMQIGILIAGECHADR